MMMLTMMMLRRRTDPKTGTHTLCKRAQLKCIWPSHKNHFERKFIGKMLKTNTGDVEMHLDIAQKIL